MKLRKRPLPGSNPLASGRFAKAAGLGLFALGCTAGAQQVFSPAPAPRPQFLFPSDSQAFSNAGTNGMGLSTSTGEPEAPSAVSTPPKDLFSWGPITAHPHLLYRFLYGNGVQVRPNDPLKTALHELSPGLLLDVGRHWTLDYTPTLSFYSNHQFRDNVGHAASLTGAVERNDWRFGLSQSYVSFSAPLVETGTQTDQETYTTALSASHSLGSKMSVDLNLNQEYLNAQSFSSHWEWSTLEWLNYQFAPRLDAGLGLGGGYVDVHAGPGEAFEQFQGRVRWRTTDKISLDIHGGGEEREFLEFRGNPSHNLFNPVFGASIEYQPFLQTRLSLTANRAVAASYFDNQVSETTVISGALNQRLLGRLNLGLSGGYNTARYVASSSGAASGRSDDFYFFNARLGCTLLKRASVSVFWQYTDNSSSQAGFGFTSKQIGFELGYRF